MFVTEPSDAVNAGMAIQTEGSRLALRASRRPQLDLWLVGWLLEKRWIRQEQASLIPALGGEI